MQFPDDRQYHADHLWAQQRPEGVWRIGITDYAQEQLGGVIFVDLPEAGSVFAQGASCASIESVKVTSDALMPVSGEVTAVNPALADAPELCNTDPYGEGWLVEVRRTAPEEGGALTAAAYAAQVQA